MTGIRRTLLLAALSVAVFLGSPAAAQAAFSDSITTASATISTATVAGPTDVTAKDETCSNARTQVVSLTWVASTSARVAGYRVTVHRTNGQVLATGNFGPDATSATITFDKFNFNMSTLLFSVTTVTGHGWTKESLRTGALPC